MLLRCHFRLQSQFIQPKTIFKSLDDNICLAKVVSERSVHLRGLFLTTGKASQRGGALSCVGYPGFRVYNSMTQRQANIAVIGAKDDPRIKQLEKLPDGANVVCVGSVEDLIGNDKDKLEEANVVVSTSFGASASRKEVSEIWPYLPNLKWMAVLSAGITQVLADELVQSDVTLTNAKGTFSHSLAEYALTSCLYFAKKITQLQENQKRGKWEPLYVEELRGRTLGVIGYGDIGQTSAKLARVFGMKIVALRRRTEMSKQEVNDGLQVYPPEELNKVMQISDYVVVSLPSTPATDKFVSKEAISQLQSHAVLINLGRGTTIDEEALIEALREKKFRGAALDVFQEEPLPESSELWKLDNVLISPHCADRTTTFLEEAMDQFIDNVKLYVEGKDLINVCDKNQGY